jgi:hypothetical protein
MFKRRIATLITDGGQFPVDSIEQIISAYDRAERKDCRLNGFAFDPENKLRQGPSLIFGDVDNHDQYELKKILKRMKEKLIVAYPTIIDSGRGFHIIQPLDVSTFSDTLPPDWFVKAQEQKWSGFAKGITDEYLRFGERFLTGKEADPCHSPSIKSCLLRPPGTVNSKNNAEVKVIQEWDGTRPPASLLLGDFYTAKLQEYNTRLDEIVKERPKRRRRLSKPFKSTGSYYDSYIIPILETPVPDFRDTIIAVVIVPYLLNIKGLPENQVYQITENWLRQCDVLCPLKFDYSRIWSKIDNARNFKYKPMRQIRLFEEMLQKSPETHLILQQKLFPNSHNKGGDTREK